MSKVVDAVVDTGGDIFGLGKSIFNKTIGALWDSLTPDVPEEDFATLAKGLQKGIDQPRRITFGRDRVGGVIAHQAEVERGGKKFVQMVVLINGAAIDALEDVYIASKPITDYPSESWDYELSDGRHTTANAKALAKMAGWTAQHVGYGQAHIFIELENNREVFADGISETEFLIRGARVWDPRDVNQHPDNERTWLWSQNAVLCALHYVRFYGAHEVPFDRLPLPWWIAAINVCDEDAEFTDSNGVVTTEKRYTTNGSFTFSSKPLEVLNQLESCFAGKIFRQMGQWYVRVGAWYGNPTYTINKDDVHGNIKIKWHADLRDRANIVRATFTDPEQNYDRTDAPPVVSQQYQLIDNQILEKSITLPFVRSSTTAQRLATIHLEQTRLGEIELPLKHKGLAAAVGRTVYLNLPNESITNKVYRVVERRFRLDGGVTLMCVEDGPGLWADNIVPGAQDLTPNSDYLVGNPQPVFDVRVSIDVDGNGIIKWNHPSPLAVNEYDIEFVNTAANEQVFKTSVTYTQVTIPNLQLGEYTARISAKNIFGQRSLVVAVQFSVLVPTLPTVFVTADFNQITLTAEIAAAGIGTQFEWEFLGTTAIPQNGERVLAQIYTRIGLKSETEYQFRVRSVNQLGASDWLNVAASTTDAADIAELIDGKIWQGEYAKSLLARIDLIDVSNNGGLVAAQAQLEIDLAAADLRLTQADTALQTKIDAGVLVQQQLKSDLVAADARLKAADAVLQNNIDAASNLLQGQITDNGTYIVALQQADANTALALNALTLRADDLESTVLQLDTVTKDNASRLVIVETVNGTQGGQISSLQTTTASHATSISRLGVYDTAAKKYAFIKTLEEADATQASRTTALEADNTSSKSRITGVETVNASQATKISALETDNGTNKTSITSLQQTTATHAQTLTTLTASDGVNTGAITALQQVDAAHASRLVSIETVNTTQGGQISSLQTTTASHATSISRLGVYDNAAGKYAFIKTLEQADATQVSRIGTLEASDSANKTRITNVESVNATQATKITTLEADNGTNKSRITAAENVNATQTSKLTTLETDNGTNKTKITNLETTTGGHASRLSAVELKSNNSAASIISLEQADAEQASRIDQITLQLNPLPKCQLVNEDSWEVGTTGAQAGFSPYGGTNRASIISGTSPYGGAAKIWKAATDAVVTGGAGGFVSSSRSLDPTKMYRYSLWYRIDPTSSARLYFGTRTVNSLAGVENANPYFFSLPRSIQPIVGRWALLVGYVYPSDFSGTPNLLSGIYDPVTGERVFAGVEYKNAANESVTTIRAYHYGPTEPNSTMYFAHPRIDVMDGTEPTFEQLINSGEYAAVSDEARAYTDTLTGEIRAERTIKVEANGKVAGIGLIAGATTGSAIYLSAEQLAILPPGATGITGAVLPFIYDAASGAIYMDTTFIRDLTASQIQGGTLNLNDGYIRNLTVFDSFSPPDQFLLKTHMSDSLARQLAWVDPNAVSTGGTVSKTVNAAIATTAVGSFLSGGQAPTIKVTGSASNKLYTSAITGYIDVQILRNGVAVSVDAKTTFRLNITNIMATDEALPPSQRRWNAIVSGGIEGVAAAVASSTTTAWTVKIVALVASGAVAADFSIKATIFEAFSSSGGLIANTNWESVQNKPATATRWPTPSEVGAPSTLGVGASGTWGVSISGNAATATKLTSVGTTFSGTYPIVINAAGVLYSHPNITFSGAAGKLTAPTFVGQLEGSATLLEGLPSASFWRRSIPNDYSLRFLQTNIDLTLPARTSIPPMSMRLWDAHNNGGPNVYGTVLDVYGRAGHSHHQIHLSRDGLRYREAFYGASAFSAWNALWDSSNAPETATRWPTLAEIGAVSTDGGTISGMIRVSLNTAPGHNFNGGHILLYTSNGSSPSIAWNRGGSTACQLRHDSSGLVLSGASQTSAANFQVLGSTYAIRSYLTSSKRHKDISHVDSTTESVRRVKALGCKGVSVGTYKKDETKALNRWLIAEDVNDVSPEVVSLNRDGLVESLDYTQMIPDLYVALADALDRIEQLEARH